MEDDDLTLRECAAYGPNTHHACYWKGPKAREHKWMNTTAAETLGLGRFICTATACRELGRGKRPDRSQDAGMPRARSAPAAAEATAPAAPAAAPPPRVRRTASSAHPPTAPDPTAPAPAASPARLQWRESRRRRHLPSGSATAAGPSRGNIVIARARTAGAGRQSRLGMRRMYMYI